MEIKISTQGMLKVLIKSGIDETDAKAIVLDLLMYGEGEKTPQKVVSSKPVSQDARATLARSVDKRKQDEVEEQEDKDKDDEDTMEDPEVQTQRTTIRKAKRLNFSEFGGPSEPLS